MNRKLTLHNDLLAGLLIMLALATDIVSQPIAHMPQELAAFTGWHPPLQLSLVTRGYPDNREQFRKTHTHK